MTAHLKSPTKGPKSLAGVFQFYLTLVSLISCTAIGTLWIVQEYLQFKEDVSAVQEAFLQSQRQVVRADVEKVVEHLHYHAQDTYDAYKKEVRNVVTQAHKTATSIYQRYRDIEALATIQTRITDALAPVRFNGENGYLFIGRMDGYKILFPDLAYLDNPDLSGIQDIDGNFVIQDMINIAKQYGEGFYSHKWSKPGQIASSYNRLTFIKYFEPLDWFIGAGTYLEDIEAHIRSEMASAIDGYLSQEQGRVIALLKRFHPPVGDKLGVIQQFPGHPELNGKLISTGSDDGPFPWGALMEELGDKGESHLIIQQEAQNRSGYRRIMLLAKLIPDSELVVGVGHFLGELDAQLAQRRQLMKERVGHTILIMLLVLLGVIAFIALVGRYLSRKTQDGFDAFASLYREAAQQSRKPFIDPTSYSEFHTLAMAAEQMINHRITAEKALRKSKAHYQSLIQSTAEGYWMLDTQFRIIDVNPALCNMLGYTTDEVFGKYPNDFVDKRNQQVFNHQMARVPNTRHRRYEITLRHKNGSDVFTIVNATTIFDESASFQYAFSLFTDITKRKRAEEDLERLATAIYHASECIIITDKNGIIQYVNPAFEKITGYSKQDAIGQSMRLLKSGKHDDTFYQQLWRTITAGEVWSGRLVNRKKDGTLFQEEGSISPVLDRNGRVTNFVAVKRDVTEETKLESQLRQAQKLEAIGTLAGGIAHDFNNILAAIIGYSELALADLGQEHPIRGNIQRILQAGRRAGELVGQILAFSRQSDTERKPVQVKLMAKEALKLIRATLPATIEIRQHLQSDSLVLADPTQIHQLIMNLCTNANHAMEAKGGILELRLMDVDLDEIFTLKHPGMTPGRYLHLSVSDTGCGMSQTVLERIFDPFFTTKPKGKGTGMGLSVLHGIVKSSHGTVTVESEPGHGSTFHLYLPLIETKLQVKEPPPGPIPCGSEKVLFVDDEMAIVELSRCQLEKLGYQVTVRTSSIEALELFKSQPDRFDLVITDMTMPNLTGDKLATEIMAIRPAMPIILCTGFSSAIDEEKSRKIGIRAFIHKPILTRELALAIRRALAEETTLATV
jgi:PAS domain S-box-containing protein